MRILLVEDDDALRSLLTQRLRAEHYAVDMAIDGDQGWEYVSTYDYDLLILDVVLPKIDGVTLCKTLRNQEYTLPILLLTAQDTRDAKRMGWEAGADDYVVKPFDEEELVARIRALLRRSSANPLPILTWGPLWLDTNTSEVSYNGTILSLTAKEYTLLEMMLRDSQHVFSNEDIIEGLWASADFPTEATVRSHIRRLRQKLNKAGAPTDLIATFHGRGYYLKPIESMDGEMGHGRVNNSSIEDRSLHNEDVDDGGRSSDEGIDARSIEDRDTSASFWDAVASQGAPPSNEPSSGIEPLESFRPSRSAQYAQALQQVWLTHKAGCLQKVIDLKEAIAQLVAQTLSAPDQAEAYRLAHTLSGTLGTFGFMDAMQLARHIEQEIHPDLFVDSTRAKELGQLVTQLEQFLQTNPVAMPSHLPQWSSEATRLMLVDDDPIFLKTMLNQLQGYGFNVSILDDPQQFWVMLDHVVPEVLILDVQMPHFNGLELCKTLRLAPEWQKLPVMFLSILGDAATQHQAFSVGADDYLAKPISAKHLSDRIRQRLQRIEAVSS